MLYLGAAKAENSQTYPLEVAVSDSVALVLSAGRVMKLATITLDDD